MADRAPGFVHLHNHSTFSLLDGMQKVDEMCAKAVEDGQQAIAITDHGNLFGAMKFGKQAKKHGIKPIVGIEAYMAPGSRLERRSVMVEGVGKKNYFHLILLAQNATGFKNLIKLASSGYLDGFYYRPRIDFDLLSKHSEGLICLAACLAGEVPTYLSHDRYNAARDTAGRFRELFGKDRYWLEIQDHGIPEQQVVNEGMVKLSRDLGIGMVATNDCHYLRKDDHFAHDVLICVGTGKTVNDSSRMIYSQQHYLKSRAEMGELFSSYPEAVENSLAITERCQFSFEDQPFHMPDFPVPDGYDLDSYFESVARDGLAERMRELRIEHDAGRLLHPLEEYDKRLVREIKVIREMGFPGYFLITWDFIRFAHQQGIPVGPGRGSAAGSLVAYALRITNIDPLQYNLLFERFLNPERVSMPDIDIDFCFRKRERVIDYVTHKYGRENVSQIITFGTLAARAAIRDVGRGLEVPYSDVDRIAKLIPAQPGQEITIDRSLADVPALREAYESDKRIKELLDVARRLEGLTRHASTHAAGVVIAPRPIVEYAPLYRGTKSDDEITTQWAKDEIEESGLLKLDFLGLKTLTLIEDTLVSIERLTGERLDLEKLPLDDAKVYQLFAEARTLAVFQFESEGMQDILRKLKPERFEDLVALNALYRPGPLGGGLIDDFIKRRHGKIKVKYPHPLLEDVLRETYGVIVYQEQVMQIASVMAGYSLGEADILRRAMGKKKVEVMEAEAKKFVAQAVEKGIVEKVAKDVFDLMSYFAGYGFNKSHSAAYALVAYQTAWLKAHHPVHFMAAVLTTEKGNTEKLVTYIRECRDMGIEVMPPDVRRSGLDFMVEGDLIRFGLSAIKNVGENAIKSIIEARTTLGGVEQLHELCAEVDLRLVNKRVLEALVQAGAMDCLGARRSQLAASVDASIEIGQKSRADREAGQGSLFGSGPSEDQKKAGTNNLPDLPEWDDATLLENEKTSLGFYISGHPLESYKELLDDFATHSITEVMSVESGTEVSIAGMISELRRRKSKKGDWWASMKLEDLTSRIEVLVFPRCYEQHHRALEDAQAVMVTGRYDVDDERIRIIADDICPLDTLRDRQVESIQLRLDAAMLDGDAVMKLSTIFRANSGAVPVLFEIIRPEEYCLTLRTEVAMGVKPSEGLKQELASLVGPGRVRYSPKSLLGNLEKRKFRR
jgi:DNA polymerase-3 subunit alpha